MSQTLVKWTFRARIPANGAVVGLYTEISFQNARKLTFGEAGSVACEALIRDVVWAIVYHDMSSYI